MYVVTFLSVVIHSDRFVCFDLYSPLSLSSCPFFDILHCRVTLPIHLCDMPHDMIHSSVWHASCIRATRLNHTCSMTHSYMWHDSFIRVTWLTQASRGALDKQCRVRYVTCESCPTHEWVTTHTWICHPQPLRCKDMWMNHICVMWKVCVSHVPLMNGLLTNLTS